MNQADPCITKSFLLHTYCKEDLSYRNYYKEMSLVPCLTNGTSGQDIEAQTYQTKTKKKFVEKEEIQNLQIAYLVIPL